MRQVSRSQWLGGSTITQRTRDCKPMHPLKMANYSALPPFQRTWLTSSLAPWKSWAPMKTSTTMSTMTMVIWITIMKPLETRHSHLVFHTRSRDFHRPIPLRDSMEWTIMGDGTLGIRCRQTCIDAWSATTHQWQAPPWWITNEPVPRSTDAQHLKQQPLFSPVGLDLPPLPSNVSAQSSINKEIYIWCIYSL